MMREWFRRLGWVAVLVIGLALYLLVLRTLVKTQNPNLVPALILLGASTVPAAFLTFAQARTGQWQVPASVLLLTAFFGGVVGLIVAGTLEFDALHDLGTLPMLFVALIEETAKLIVPVIVLLTVIVRHKRRLPSDGLVIGVASGMGFAALETMGYAFTALLSSNGNVGALEETLLVRGLTSPAGHTAWTGLTCGALWMLASAPSVRNGLIFLGTFAGAVALHTAWDSFGSVVAYVILAIISLGWLVLRLRKYRAFHPAGRVPVLAG
ncbi:PrsW family intramembrane metalloprotease [Actinoplanes sp. CA-015351]|uniref:PrsW family intramembrane metalloprotease n=1 Tax=Actinoplanes sp. CA-015351 TaxID=3239897 RepID=UPI003D9915C7